MKPSETPHWTELTDGAGRRLCCICRLYHEESRSISWCAKPILGDIGCWTCLDCWGGVTPETRQAHRLYWEPREWRPPEAPSPHTT